VALRGALEASLAKRVAAREEERRRLRRDLHDELGPTLAGLTLGLDTAREAFRQLPPGCQQLIAMLMEDPAVPDTGIGARLGIPAGSAGPERARCLERLRRYPAVAALMDTGRPAALTVRAPLPPP
jgi:Histidine kinase